MGIDNTVEHPIQHDVKHVFGLPYCIGVPRPGLYTIYPRSLLLAGHGYPLPDAGCWANYDDDWKEIHIGDLGTLNPYSCFQFRFNIFLPPDHPRQQLVPENFRPLSPPLTSADFVQNDQYLPPNTIIKSSGINVVKTSVSPLDIHIGTPPSEGSALILPFGCLRTDLTEAAKSRVHEYMSQHALEWYQEANIMDLAALTNGAIYLVTGCDRATAWVGTRFQGGDVNIYEKATGYDERQGTWAAPKYLSTKNRPKMLESEKGTIFMRGIRLYLHPSQWVEHFIDPEESNVPYSEVLKAPQTLAQRILNKVNPHLPKFARAPDFYKRTQFHPSDVVAQVILSQFIDVHCLLLNDETWMAATKSSVHLDETLREETCETVSVEALSRMVSKIFQTNSIVSKNRVAGLRPKMDYAIANLSRQESTSGTDRRLFTRKTQIVSKEAAAVQRLMQEGHWQLRTFGHDY